jgi:CheY-like chemotaxis protein
MKVLLVEDDVFYSQAISELLQDRFVDVVMMETAADVLSVDFDGFDAVIIDVMLANDPDASGISLEESRGGFHTGVAVARRVRKKNPKLPIVLTSAYGPDSEAEAWAAEQAIPFVYKGDGRIALLRALGRLGLIKSDPGPLAFIVHGHDEGALRELKDYVQNTLKWREPVILREQPSLGKTIIEKFEEYAGRIDCVFVLLTPDDKVRSDDSDEEKRRSRQNVIFECGFFYGSLDRRSGRIIILHSGPIELPSDISGIVWIDIQNGVKSAGEEIRKEIEHLL